MAKKRNAELGDVLDAVEKASDSELRILRDINKKLGAGVSGGVTVRRSNGAPTAPNESQINIVLREVQKRSKQSKKNDEQTQNKAQMRAYNRNKDKLRSNDVETAVKAAEKIIETAVKRSLPQRDARGRFVTASKIGGVNPNQKPRAPRQPKGGSIWSQPPTKSAQAQASAKQDANREAVEEQTKETIQRQDETNDLLKELVKQGKKTNKVVSGGSAGGGGLDINVGGGGLLRKLGRKIFGRRGGKIAAGVAATAGAAALGKAAMTSEGAVTDAAGRVRGANGRFLSTAEKEAMKVGEGGAVKLAEKGGLKAVGKIGLRAIPVLGTAISAGLDAYNGWNDTEGQAAAFGLRNGQEASTRQKTEYSAANIADLGGLVSGTSSLLGAGADLLGFHDTAKALTFTTADMAKGIDDVGTKIGDTWMDFWHDFSKDSDEKSKKDDQRTDQMINAINALGLQAGNAQTTYLNPVAQAKVADTQGTLLADMQAAGVPGLGYQLGGAHSESRGVRNNNFGNIDFHNQAGAKPEFNDAGKKVNGHNFAVWATPEEGVRGMANQLQRYATGKTTGKKLNTVSSIISTWAPSSDNNDTVSYVKEVAAGMGVGPNDVLDMTDPATNEALMRAIAKRETGSNINMSSEALQASLGTLNSNGQWESSKTAAETKELVKKGGEIKPQTARIISTAAEAGVSTEGMPAEASKGLNALLDLYKGSDAAASKFLGGLGVGHFGAKPSKELTLPKGAAMPAGLRINPGNTAQLKDVGHLAGLDVNAGTAGATAQKTAPAGIVDILRSSAADTFDWATQGISGGGIMDGLLGGMNPWVADVLKPVTGAAGDQLDKWIGSGRNGIMDMLNGRPKTMGKVTDLAASGAAQPVTMPIEATKTDNDMLDQLKEIASHLEDLLGVTKDNQKNAGGSNPSDTKHTAQPAPNPNIPMMSASNALAELFRGLL